jgi:hypothetical protein
METERVESEGDSEAAEAEPLPTNPVMAWFSEGPKPRLGFYRLQLRIE